MSEKKTTLPCLKNQDWRTVKSKTEKVNHLLTNIPTNITELNDLIYARAKLVCEKIGVPLKTNDRKSKSGWELRLESQIKRLRQQARILKRNIKKYLDETERTRQLELKKIALGNQRKILAKEGRLKRYQNKAKQNRQNRTFQNNEKKSTNNQAKPYQQPDSREAKRFWSKIWEWKDHNKKAEWITNMETELRMLVGPQVNIHPDGVKATFIKISNWKTPGLDGIYRFWFKNSPPHTTDLLPKWINSYR